MRTTVALGNRGGNDACRSEHGGADFPAGTPDRLIAAGAGRPEDGGHATIDRSV